MLGIFGWLICGGLLSFIASRIFNNQGDDPRISIGIGAGSGIVGGAAFSLFSGSPVSGFNLWSLVCAALASLIAMVIWYMVRARVPHKQHSIRRSY